MALTASFTTPTPLQRSCCYGFNITDTSTVTGFNATYGVFIAVEYQNLDTTWTRFSYNNWVTGIVIPVDCGQFGVGSITIRTVLEVWTISNGSKVNLYQTVNSSPSTLTILEWQPTIGLPATYNCCLNVNQPNNITLAPTYISLSYIAPNASCGTCSLVYQLYTPSGDLINTVTFNHASLVPLQALSTYIYNYTATLKGTYKLVVTLTNCCESYVKIYLIDLCNSFAVQYQDCNKLVLSNLSQINALTYTINQYDGTSFVLLTTTTLSANSTLTSTLSTGIYQLIVGAQTYYFLMDCDIKNCKQSLLSKYLCRDSDECDIQEKNNRINNWVTYKALSDILYAKFNQFIQTQSIYTIVEISSDDLLYLNDLITQLSLICAGCSDSDCVECTDTFNSTLNSADCGCSK